ncbi:hypothetical protein SprV_0301382800 [Sparganum proliferum]
MDVDVEEEEEGKEEEEGEEEEPRRTLRTYVLKVYFLSSLAGINSLVLSCPTSAHYANSVSSDKRLPLSALCQLSKMLLSPCLFPDIAAETLITSLCFLARLQPDALERWQSCFGDWLAVRPLLTASAPIGEEVLSTMLFLLYSSCKAGGPENSCLVILVLNDLVRLLTPTREDCDAKLVYLFGVLAHFLTLSGEGPENPSLLSLATDLAPTNIALSFVWTCIKSLADIPQFPKEPAWIFAAVYAHLYERSSTNVWTITLSPSPLSEQLYEQLTATDDAPADPSLDSSCFCLRLLIAVARNRPLGSSFRSALLQSVVAQNLIALASSSSVWSIFQRVKLTFELIKALTTLVPGLSDPKSLEDASKAAAVLSDLFSSEQFMVSAIRDEWLHLVPSVISAFVDCLTRPDPTLCSEFAIGVAPLKRSLLTSLAETTLLLIKCALEMVSQLSRQPVNEEKQQLTGYIQLHPVALAAWTGLSRLLTARISPATPATYLVYHIYGTCLTAVANGPCPLPSRDLGTLRWLVRDHLATTLQGVLTVRASSTDCLTPSPDRVALLAALLTIELELNSWDSGSCGDQASSIDNRRLTFKRFIDALPLGDSRTVEERTVVGVLLHGLLEISMAGFNESTSTEGGGVPGASAAALIPPHSTLGRRSLRLFVFTLGALLEYLDRFGTDEVGTLDDQALLGLVNAFSTELHAIGRRPPFTDLERQLLSTDPSLQRRLLDLLIDWVKSVDVLEPSRHILWPPITPVAWPKPTVKPRPSRAGLPSSSSSSTTNATAFYATSLCAVFRLCAAAYASSSDVRACLAVTRMPDGNGRAVHPVESQSSSVRSGRRSRRSLRVDNETTDGVAVVANSLWPLPLSRYLSAYETPPSLAAAPPSTSFTSERPLLGVALSTWFSLHTDQTSLPDSGTRQEFVSALPLTGERILSYSARGLLVHLATLEAVSTSSGLARRFSSGARPSATAQQIRSQPTSDLNCPSCWSFQFWNVPHLTGVYVRVWRRCVRHSRSQHASGCLPSAVHSLNESDLQLTLVGDAFLPLTDEEATAVHPAVGWNHLFLTVLWNSDAIGVLSGWVSCTVNGSAYTEQALLLHQVSGLSDFEGGHSCASQTLLRRRLGTSSTGDADCLYLWIGQKFTACENERQPGAVVLRSGQISLGNVAIFTGSHICSLRISHLTPIDVRFLCAIPSGPILRPLQPEPGKSCDSQRIEQTRCLALSLALCGPEWCDTVADFDRGDCLLRANAVLRGLLHHCRLCNQDIANQVHLSEAANKLLTARSSERPTTAPWFSLLKTIIKRCLLAMIPSYSPDRVFWFSSCEFTLYEGDIPRLHFLSSAMLYANRPQGSASTVSMLETVLETRPLREGVATGLHPTDCAIRHGTQSENGTSHLRPSLKRDLEPALGPLGGIQPVLYLLGALICKEDVASCSSSTIAAGFDLLLSLIRHSASAAVQFYRPLASDRLGLRAYKPASPTEQCDHPDADRLILRSLGCHLLASLFSQFASAPFVISNHLTEVLLGHVFLRLQPCPDPVGSYLLCDPDLLKCLLFFPPTTLVSSSSAVEASTHLMPLLINRLASSLSDGELTSGDIHQRLLSVNVATMNRFRIAESVINSFRAALAHDFTPVVLQIHFANCGTITAVNSRLSVTWLEALARLFSHRLRLAAMPELAETLKCLQRTLVAVDPDLYYSAFTRAFGAGLSTAGPLQRRSTLLNNHPSDHCCPSDLAALAQTIASSVLALLPCRRHSAPVGSVGSTSAPDPSEKGNCVRPSEDGVEALETQGAGQNSSELHEVKEEQTASPTAGPQKPRIVTDWPRLEPALSLEGASKAEETAIAKFQADLRSDTESEMSAGGVTGLLTSAHQSNLAPCHLSVSNLFTLSGRSGSCHSLITAVCHDDNVLLLRRASPADDCSFPRCRSLPRLDLCVEEDSVDHGSTQPEQSPFQQDAEADSKDADALPLRSQPTGPTRIKPALIESPAAVPPDSDTPLSLKQNRLLSDALLSALEAFWSSHLEVAFRTSALEVDLDRQAQLAPPVWFIYHLAGHPCCRFRECALTLYDLWCGSLTANRHSIAFLEGVGRQMAGQILSPPRSVTLLLQGAALEASDCPFHDCENTPGIVSPSSSFDAPDASSQQPSPSPSSRSPPFDMPSVLKHRLLSSSRLIDKAFCLLPLNGSCSESVGLSLRLPVALAVIAAATVDTAVLAWLAVSRPSDSRLCEALERQLTVSLVAIERFASFAKCFPDILKLLRVTHLCETLVELVLLLQSMCFSICCLWPSCEEIGPSAVRLHDASCQWARLLSSVFSGFDVVAAFPLVQQLISRLTDNSIAFYSEAAKGSSACVIHECLLRVHLSLLGGLCLRLLSLHPGVERTDQRRKLLSHLNWTVNGIMHLLLSADTESPQNQFKSAPDAPLAPPLNSASCEALQVDMKFHGRLPIIDQLERALVTALVNAASHALKNKVTDVFDILSNCLLHLLSAWTSAFVDDFSMSEAGRYLIRLLSLEPNLLGRTPSNVSLGFLSLLRRNLKILEAVLLLPNSDKNPPRDPSITPPQDAILEDLPIPPANVDGNLAVSPTSISTIYDWLDNVTSLQLHSPSSGAEPKHTVNSCHMMTASVENCLLCNAMTSPQETPEFLDQLRLFYDQGQRQWLATVSQVNYILTVVAPYHWTVLSGSMDHECSVFSGTSQIPTFHQLDPFQSDFRDRRRRRACFFSVDERFIRKSHRSGLVQHLGRHPLQDLLLPSFFMPPLSEDSCRGCAVPPYSRFPPSCQGLFEPSPIIAPDSCLGVWPCRLVQVSAACPLTGDLTLDVFWLHLCLNVPPDHQPAHNRRTPSLVHGLNGDKSQSELFTCPLNAIACVEERRFELRDLAAEIFFHRSFGVPPLLLALRSKSERDHFLHTLAGACQQALSLSGHANTSSFVNWWSPSPSPVIDGLSRSRLQPPPISLRTICDSLVAPFPTPVGNAMRNRLIQAQVTWLRGEMCNFDYLMVLNTVAGRTYNDLTQYPIFPWIISDFESEVLDLSKPSSFRRLNRPISVQTEARAEAVASHYEELRAQQESLQAADESQRNLIFPIFHYPSYCSNEAITLHFLFRLAPFAFRLIQFQDGHFDSPDRSFHSVATEWQLATSSVACVKELVPEFFIRPDLFVNWENFELGTRQNGSPVDCVVLPPWAKGDPRLFTLVNRAAFESAYVTAHLPAWIDLVFGYKQTGRNAERALNLYNPFTYFGAIDVDAIEDPVRRCAVQSMIRNYGQVPRQLFPNHPHPRRTVDPLHDTLTREVAVSGKAAEFFGLIWLIRLFLSSLLSPAPLPAEKGLVNCGSWDPSVALVNPPSETDETEERQQEINWGLNVSVVPQTAGAPLDTVIGLNWGKWAGSPATDPLRVVWLTNLQGVPLMGAKKLSTLVGRAFNATGALWFTSLGDTLTSLGPQLPNPTTSNGVRREDGVNCYWIPLITSAFSHACLVRIPEQPESRKPATDRQNMTTLLVKFSLRSDSRSAQSSGICILARPLHAGAVFAASTTKYCCCIRLPFACDQPHTPISSFLVLPEAPTICQRPSEFHVLLGTVDGGLYFRTFLASEVLAKLVRRRDQRASCNLHFSFPSSSSSSDTSPSPPRHAKREPGTLDGPFHPKSKKHGGVKCTGYTSSPVSSLTWRTLVGHNGAPVSCLAACPAHGLVASGDTSGRVVIWDLASGCFLHLLSSLQPSPRSPERSIASPRPRQRDSLGATLESRDTSSSSEDGEDPSAEAQPSRFIEVCGLAFNQLTGELLTARSSVFGRKEIWLGLYTADGRQACTRVLDFSAEFGFLSTTPRCPPSLTAVDAGVASFQMPITFSSTMEGAEVDCILIGGMEGCLVWLSSWTLDTISVMRLNQPTPCPITTLLFAPLSGRLAPSTMHPVNARKARQSGASTETSSEFYRALYVVDALGWLYFLEPTCPPVPPKTTDPAPRQSLPLKKPGTAVSTSLVELPGLWL